MATRHIFHTYTHKYFTHLHKSLFIFSFLFIITRVATLSQSLHKLMINKDTNHSIFQKKQFLPNQQAFAYKLFIFRLFGVIN